MTTAITHLYKYGSLNKHSKAVFSTPKIYLCAADKLNDPFECRPLYSFGGTKEQIIGSLAQGAMGANKMLTESGAIAIATKLYEEGRHKDPAMLANLEREFIKMSTQGVGIYCLSEVPDNILMWSHYAAGHAGFCIEFEASDTTPMFGQAQQVNYAEHYPTVGMFGMDGREKADLTFLTKHSGWSYEREWRIIANIEGPGHAAYPSELMTRVIFGIGTSTTVKNKIRLWTSRRENKVRFAQATRHPTSFAIEIQPIS